MRSKVKNKVKNVRENVVDKLQGAMRGWREPIENQNARKATFEKNRIKR